MIGSCDCCNVQDVEVSRAFVTGIETFACNKCRGVEDNNDEVDPDDTGSLFITREKDGRVTVKVRSPRSTMESAISIPHEAWLELTSLDR